MVGSPTASPTPKNKAIGALLPHAISLDQFGDQEMADAIIRFSRNTSRWRFTWRYVEPYTATLLDESTPPSLNRAITFFSPSVPWHHWNENTIARWAAAALAVPYSEEVGWSVVDILLQLASSDSRRRYIPTEVWTWLKKQSSLPPVCEGRDRGGVGDLVRHVRGLGDLDLLKSYLLLVWSEWNTPRGSGFVEMQASIAEDLGGIGTQRHREDLIKRLGHILAEIDRGLEHLKQYKPWIGEHCVIMRRGRYETLRETLLDVDRKAMETLAGMPHLFFSTSPLIPVDTYRIQFDLRLFAASSVSMISRLEQLASPEAFSDPLRPVVLLRASSSRPSSVKFTYD